MQFDFQVSAYGSQQIDVKGKFFKYTSGGGQIRVRTNTGESIDLLPGQGVWNVDFAWLSVQDRSGIANGGTVLAGDFDFHDDRISGNVSVIDNAKARTIAATAFSLATGTTSQAGCLPTCMLWNPVGSGKNIYISRAMTSSDQAGQIDVGWSGTVLGGSLNSNITAKRAGGIASQMKYIVSGSLTTPPTAANPLVSTQALALTTSIYAPVEPLMLPPGYGFYAQHNTAGAKLLMAVDFVEENV